MYCIEKNYGGYLKFNFRGGKRKVDFYDYL